MKADDLLDAIGDVKDAYVSEAGHVPSRGSRKKRLLVRKAALTAAAFAAVLLLAIPVEAELRNGYVSNLLAPLYGGAQTELIDQIGRPVNASATVGDYTLQADAVIGDKYNMAIVYSLTRTDGKQLEAGLSFAGYENTAKRGSWGGTYRFRLSEDQKTLFIIEEWTAANRLRPNRKATVTFTNLVRAGKEGQEAVLLEQGVWELKFTIRYEDASVEIPIADTVVEDGAGKAYTVHNIILSPVGVHLDLTGPNRTKYYSVEESPLTDFTLSVILDDGRVVNIEDRNLESHGDMEDDRHKANLGARFDEPIPLERMQTLVVCGTPFPIAK